MFFNLLFIIALIKCDKFLLNGKKGHKHIVSIEEDENNTKESGSDYLDSTGPDQLNYMKDLRSRAKQKLKDKVAKEGHLQSKAGSKSTTTIDNNRNSSIKTGDDHLNTHTEMSKPHKKAWELGKLKK